MGKLLDSLGLTAKAKQGKNRRERRRDAKWARGNVQRAINFEIQMDQKRASFHRTQRMLRKGREAHERAVKRQADRKAFEATLKTH